MKFKDSKLCSKLINNYTIEYGSSGIGFDSFLELEEFYAYSGKMNNLKVGYYPKKIIVVGYQKDDTPIYLVFKKHGEK